VTRLVRHALLPEARQVHEAEVLLGGLLRVVAEPGYEPSHPDEVRYDFHEGLRPLLLDAVPTADAAEVLARVSSFVEEHLGQGWDFRAILADPSAARGTLRPDQSPFARVAAEVLLRLGGDHARLVSREAPRPSVAPVTSGPVIGKIEPSDRKSSGPQPRQAAGGETIHDKLSRVRRPRVSITYQVETGGALALRELPFVVGVLADLAGQPALPLKPLRNRMMIEVDRDNFDSYMAQLAPALSFRVPNRLSDDDSQLAVSLSFRSMDDFSPAAVSQQVEPLRRLLDSRGRLIVLRVKVEGNASLERALVSILFDEHERSELLALLEATEPTDSDTRDTEDVSQGEGTVDYEIGPKSLDLLGIIRRTGGSPPEGIDRWTRNVMQDLLASSFLERLLGSDEWSGSTHFDLDIAQVILSRISELDALLSAQVAAIIHHPYFQKLEGSWRGLHYLVVNTETSSRLKIKVLHVSRLDLVKDLDSAVEFDQSQIFKKLFEDEFGVLGGEPFGAMIVDHEFSNHPEDIDLIEKMSNVAAAAFCPFIAAASPLLFGFESWHELAKPRDLEKIFSISHYEKWNRFRESDDSRFVSLVLPRALARLPYGSETRPIEEFGFEEVDASKPVPHDQFCWMNAAYVMGARLTDSFAKFGTCTAIRGVEGGGKVEGLPTFSFMGDDGEIDPKCGSSGFCVPGRRSLTPNDARNHCSPAPDHVI
jgi:type VI secretion system protein ImpC